MAKKFIDRYEVYGDDPSVRVYDDINYYGLCIGEKYDKSNEDRISDILRQCYYEWISFKGEDNLIECVESICIALGKYPLNVDGNPAISKKWRNYVMEKRKLK